MEQNKYPQSWCEIADRYTDEEGYMIDDEGRVYSTPIDSSNESVFFNCNTAIAFIKFKKLIELSRDYHGDWKPDFSDNKSKWYIEYNSGSIQIEEYHSMSPSPLVFKDKETATIFYNNFRDMIAFAFKYIYN